MCSPYQESNTQFYFILHGKKKNPKYKGPQLTLEQHKLELRGSTYTWIFFNKYTVGLPYSHIRDLRIQSTVGISFHIWLNSQMWKYRCSGLTTGLKDPWIWVHLGEPGASLVAQRVQNLPAMQETWVWSLSQEDPLEKGIATYSSILAWKIPWTEELGGLNGDLRFLCKVSCHLQIVTVLLLLFQSGSLLFLFIV